MTPKEFSTDQSIRYEAAVHLRRTENIRQALLAIREHPEGFAQRVAEFDENIVSMNRLMRYSGLHPEFYRNLIYLRGGWATLVVTHPCGFGPYES